MKVKKLLTLLALSSMLVACGSHIAKSSSENNQSFTPDISSSANDSSATSDVSSSSSHAASSSADVSSSSQAASSSNESQSSLPDNSKTQPYSIDQMIEAMKDYSVGQESTKLFYVTGKAVNVSFDKEWSSYSCFFEGHEKNSVMPFELYGAMLSLNDLENPQNVRKEDIEGTVISFYGRAYCYQSNGKKVYQIGYVHNGSKIDPQIYKINKNIPGLEDNWKIPVSGKVDIKQTYADFSGNNQYGIYYTPTVGQPKLLVIPLWYEDTNNYISDEKEESVRSDIEKAFFGTNEQTGWRSVKSYYEEESGGLLQLQGVVSEFISIPATSNFFDNNDRINGNIENLIDFYFSVHPDQSRKDFDTNGDGVLDGVIFVNGARHINAETAAHCDSLGEAPNLDNPTASFYMWVSVFEMYGENYYSHTGVLLNSQGYGNTRYCELDTSTFIHEMGHMLGVQDYYDYSRTYSPGGDYSMQDTLALGAHDAFSVMAYGWADPYIPTESCTIEIGAFQSTKDLILLTPHWNKQDSPFDEYLLLELYTPTGLNQFNAEHDRYGDTLPDQAGIRLWHVDARLSAFINHQFCTNLTTDALCQYSYWYAMSNTYSNVGPASVLGSNYYDYNLLQFIRNNTNVTYRPDPSYSISNDTMFKDGDSFDMTTFGRQFKKTGKLNSGLLLGWSFSVSISGTGENTKATITLTKQ